MLGYIVPFALIGCMFTASQLTFEHIWLSLLTSLVLALLLPYGNLYGKPLFLRVLGLPDEAWRRRRKGYRRNRYY